MNLKNDIKNRTCYYFDDMMAVRYIDSMNILLDEKFIQNFHGFKPLRIWFDKIDGFIKIYDGIKYLILLGHSWYDETYDSIKYLISEKSGITDSINHNFSGIRIDSYNSLAIEKILTFHNVVILIKSVVNKNKSNYFYNIFLEKGSNKDKFNTQYF